MNKNALWIPCLWLNALGLLIFSLPFWPIMNTKISNPTSFYILGIRWL